MATGGVTPLQPLHLKGNKMTEEQIERRVEAMMDKADAKFISGKWTRDEYNQNVKQIGEWAETEYKKGN